MVLAFGVEFDPDDTGAPRFVHRAARSMSPLVPAHADDGGTQVEIVRHQRGADDAEREEQALRRPQRIDRMRRLRQRGADGPADQEEIDDQRACHQDDKSEDNGFDSTKARALQSEDEEHVEAVAGLRTTFFAKVLMLTPLKSQICHYQLNSHA